MMSSSTIRRSRLRCASFLVGCFLSVLFMLATMPTVTHSEFIHYNKHVLRPGYPEYMLFPKYSKKDVPNWEPGHGRSFIDLSSLTFASDCNFLSTEECKDTNFELLMFEEPTDFPWVDYWPERKICCDVSGVIIMPCPICLFQLLDYVRITTGCISRRREMRCSEHTDNAVQFAPAPQSNDNLEGRCDLHSQRCGTFISIC
jgi:hypothetical protein